MSQVEFPTFMKVFFISNRFQRLKVPGALLLTLLQRTPLVRVAAEAESVLIASPVGNVLRSVVTAVASLGAIHSMAGATPLVANPSSATNGLTTTVGATVDVAYTVTGTQTPPASWRIDGSIPPGLNFSGRTTAGVVNVTNLRLQGTPTTAGSFDVTLIAYEGTNATLTPSPTYSYTITVNGGNTAPSITTQPQSQTVNAGQSATFTVSASGSPTPTFQWRKDGVNINGATSSSLTLNSVTTADAGTYSVVVTNSAGSATSNNATLTVNTAPSISSQPQSQTVTAGANATFSVTASGSPAPSYQWRKDGTNISGATSASLSLTNVSAANAGTYTVVVSNSAGSVTSSGAVLTVNAAPTAPSFTQQPNSQTVVAGATVTFTATVSASPAATFQWRKDGVALSNGGRISGATTASLTITSVSAADTGSYTLVATNTVGSTTSSAASLALGTSSNRGRIVNLSALTGINSGETFIFGFFIGGAGTVGTKPILMRAVGPSMSQFGVTTALGDPLIEFYTGSTKASENNDWGGDASVRAAMTAVQAFPFTSDTSKDAAVYVPAVTTDGARSIKIAGVNSSSGTVLAELYDVTANSQFTATTPRLINVSLLKNVGDLTTLGFFIDGSTSVRLLIRAVGPTLGASPFNVPGTIGDPQLQLYRLGESTPIASNDNWGGGSDLVTAFADVQAFGLSATSKDAAMIQTLPPGGYTVQVKPASGATGQALIEVYELP